MEQQGGTQTNPTPPKQGSYTVFIISLTHDPQAYVADCHKHTI